MLNHAKHRRSKPAAWKRAAAAGLATATVATGAAVWAVQSQAATLPVVVDSLTLSTDTPSATAPVTATAKVHAGKRISLQSLTVAVRAANGANYDFPGAIQTTLGTSQTTFKPDSRTFPAGKYTYFVAYKAGGVWKNLTPVGTFTSGAVAPAPTPTPTSTPTPTATPKPTPSATATPTPTPTPTLTPSPSPTLTPSPTATPKPTPSATATPTPTPTPTLTPTPSPSASSSPAAGGPLGIAGSWRPVFADEFNSSSLDSSKWTPNWLGCPTCTTPPVTGSETAAYAPSQVSVGGGSLHLTTAKQDTVANGKTYPYRSGMVQSNGKAQFTYGAFEARIYLPAAGTTIANWPAFWTDGQNWPTDGEMDIMEGLGGDACYHYHSPSGGPGGCAPGNYSGWHTYGAEWKPGSVTYYYDGKQVGQITTGISSSPQYLILNNAVSPEGGQIVAPADMQVDYVRVWQH
ncbi:family 16 glycosylhydrolase [Kitasatospora indigofera]|uniref:glycoside hydrolase family 16 protein n=1 Tax=Kitasatospora indigofera TaxID=67307 RepID=UPI0036667FA4